MLCIACEELPLPLARQGERHVAVRFGDQFRYRVIIDGVERTEDVLEAYAGPPGEGWAIAHAAGYCGCGCPMLFRITRADVSLERIA
ncbi:MAG: hypothetical protein ACSLE9_09135 [Burkholderiaceae bacterium]